MTNNGTLNYNLTSEKPAYMLSEENYTKYINERNKFDPTYPDPNDIRFDAPQYSYSVEGTSLYKESSSGELTLVGSVYYPKTGNLVKFENNQAIELDEPATGNKVPLNSIKKLIPGIEYEFIPTIPDYSKEYLTFVALENGTFKLSRNAISYSLDNGETWTSLAANTASPTITAGNKIMWKTTLTPTINNGIGTFSATGNFDAQGNPMSLLYGDDFKGQTDLTGKNSAFNRLFYQNTKIVNVKNLSLPATTLVSNCYNSMFKGCTGLTTAPELPATTLAQNCYNQMFYGCTSLTTAPVLPATTLASYCYAGMFAGCTGLVASPQLPATTLASLCYDSMFTGSNVLPDCSNIDFTSQTVVASGGLRGLFSGTKVTDADLQQILPLDNNNRYCLPVTTLASDCYGEMFYNCTSLTTAPVLPATKLESNCYSGMFRGCASLTTAPALPATTLAQSCYGNMFYGCTSLTTAPVLPATTLASDCYQGMFAGCTSLTTAPVLPATTLVTSCYGGMFAGCTSLTTAPELPATTLADQCYQLMFRYCTSLTTAPVLPAITLTDGCYSNMFNGCTNLNYIKAMFTTTPSASYTQSWVNGVSATGTFVKNSAATWTTTGVNGVPSGWTIQTANE